MASRLLTTYKTNIQSLELEPSGGGCFEVTANGERVYSKLETGQFPEEDQIVKAIGDRL